MKELLETRRDVFLKVPIGIRRDGEEFHAFCPALKGLHVSGRTEKEAMENVITAVNLYLEDMVENGEGIPMGIEISTVHHVEVRNIQIPLWPILQASGVR